MHDLLMDLIFHLTEAQQALIMFGAMVLMIVLAVPIPIAVAIGTAIGYFMMDLNLVQVALSMYTGWSRSPRNCPTFCVCWLTYGARGYGAPYC